MIKLLLLSIVLMIVLPAKAGSSVVEPLSGLDESVITSSLDFFWGADPFYKRPGFVKSENAADGPKPESFKLKAIIYDPKDPLAIVSGETVGVGDIVDIYEVKEIGPQYVILEGAGRRFELDMPPPKPERKRSEIKALPNQEGEK